LPVQDVLQAVEVNQEALLREDHVIGAQHLVEAFLEVVAPLGGTFVDLLPRQREKILDFVLQE
jgi:hypothetical protein